MEEKRLHCNVGTQYMDMVGNVAHYGTVYSNHLSKDNMLSLTELIKVRRIVFDSADDNVFKVIRVNRKIFFSFLVQEAYTIGMPC